MTISLNSFLKEPFIQERIPSNLTNSSQFLCVPNYTFPLFISNYPLASNGLFENMPLQECHPSQGYLVAIAFGSCVPSGVSPGIVASEWVLQSQERSTKRLPLTNSSSLPFHRNLKQTKISLWALFCIVQLVWQKLSLPWFLTSMLPLEVFQRNKDL